MVDRSIGLQGAGKHFASPGAHQSAGIVSGGVVGIAGRCSGGGRPAGVAPGARGEFVNSNPKRPLMHRWPSVTELSIGEVTLTIWLSWTWRSTAQPTPQYGQIVGVTDCADSSHVPAARMSCS